MANSNGFYNNKTSLGSQAGFRMGDNFNVGVGKWNPGVAGNPDPIYFSRLHVPDNPLFSGLSDGGYWNEFNTPLGQVGVGTGYKANGYAGLDTTFTPNAKAQAMAQALRSLLGR